MFKIKLKSILESLPAIIISTLIVAGLVFAWTEPSQSPPNGNTPPPLNASDSGQSKSGGLIINTGGAATGLVVDKGVVGIGTQTPRSWAKLDIKKDNGQGVNIYTSGVGGLLLGYDGSTIQARDAGDGNTANLILQKWGGRVGIGVTPSKSLDVAGTVRISANESWSNNGWGRSISLLNGNAITWDVNSAGLSYGIGHTNTGLYFGRAWGDSASAPMSYDMYINDSGAVNIGNLSIGTQLCLGGVCRGSWPSGSGGGGSVSVPSGTWCGAAYPGGNMVASCMGYNPSYSCPSGYERFDLREFFGAQGNGRFVCIKL